MRGKIEEMVGNDMEALVFLEAEGCRKLDILRSGLNTEEEDLEQI